MEFWNFVTMRTAFFAIIIANIVCAFDASKSFNSRTYKNIFPEQSAAFITYVEFKDVSSLKGPSYIKQLRDKENTAFTPIDLSIVTSLLLNGAKGSTKKELMSFLKITDDKRPSRYMYLPELSYLLNDIESIESYLGSAIYVQKSVNLTTDFSSLCRMMNEFHCSISKVDFRNNIQTAKAINSWVQKKTNNEILHIISPVNIDKDTKIMLVNIMYLNIGWPNIKGKIQKRKINISPSKMYLVPSIKLEKSTFIHGRIPHWNATFFEIHLNAHIIMIMFLPDEGMDIDFFVKKINYVEFQSIKAAFTNNFEQNMELYLPKFTTEYYNNMTDFFRRKGVTTMFENDADFARLSNIPLKVNNIVQAISIKINERNSDAPNVDRSKVKKPVDAPHKFYINRPFYYIMEVYGERIFSGLVITPDFMRDFRKDEL